MSAGILDAGKTLLELYDVYREEEAEFAPQQEFSWWRAVWRLAAGAALNLWNGPV
jgi:hypothetical protein